MAGRSATPPPSSRSVTTPPAHYGTGDFHGITLRCMLGFGGAERVVEVGSKTTVSMIGRLLGMETPISVVHQGVAYKQDEKPFEFLGFAEEETVQIVISPPLPRPEGNFVMAGALGEMFLEDFPAPR